jgi:hypothetical protein
MALKHPDEVMRILKELDEAINETARFEEAFDGAPQPEATPSAEALPSTKNDRRRNQRRGVIDNRRTDDRRGSASRPKA